MCSVCIQVHSRHQCAGNAHHCVLSNFRNSTVVYQAVAVYVMDAIRSVRKLFHLCINVFAGVDMCHSCGLNDFMPQRVSVVGGDLFEL